MLPGPASNQAVTPPQFGQQLAPNEELSAQGQTNIAEAGSQALYPQPTNQADNASAMVADLPASVTSQPPEVSPDPGLGSTIKLAVGDNQSSRVQLQGQGLGQSQPAPKRTMVTIAALQAQQEPAPGQDAMVPPTPTFEAQPQPPQRITIAGGAPNQSVPVSEPDPQPAQQ